MLIDVHVHTFPDELAPRALKKLVEKCDHYVTPASDGTIQGLLADMRQMQVDYAVICPIATKPSQFGGILSEALAIRDGARGADAARHIHPFASVHPFDEARFDHLAKVAENGIRGIKLHPYYQSCVLDTPEMLEYFRCCRDLNLVVQCHCGFDIGFPFEPICGPERVARVIHEVPGLHFIAAHLGGWKQWGSALDNVLGKNVFLDTSILPQNFEEDAPNRLLREHPVDRLLFATDWPWLSFTDGIRFVRKGGFKPTQEAAIFGGNAAALLGITSPAPWK